MAAKPGSLSERTGAKFLN